MAVPLAPHGSTAPSTRKTDCGIRGSIGGHSFLPTWRWRQASRPRAGAARTFDLTTASIADINAAFDAGALTSERLTQLYLARIAAYDKSGPKLNAVSTSTPRPDRKRGRWIGGAPHEGSERSAARHPGVAQGQHRCRGLAGDRRLLWPSRFAGHARCRADQRLRRAGCVILGLTNMSEFASGPAISTLGGQIRNPYALDRSPAGSSGGNGAALAAGFAAFALGTDTGGSIRGPASANGIAGLRPTYGLTGRGGIIPLALSLDTVGPMAGHVADLAAVLNVMAGPDPRDSAAVGRDLMDYTAALGSIGAQGSAIRFGSRLHGRRSRMGCGH